MAKHSVKVGIIGGTGLEDIADHMLAKDRKVIPQPSNDFGETSGDFVQGEIAGIPVVLLSRHGRGHRINPSQVNYRANIAQLKSLGCTHILMTTACGSLREEIKPGQLVVPDSFIDRTYLRKNTLYDGTSPSYKGVYHVPSEPAFHPATSEILLKAAEETTVDVKKGGTVVTIEGPRFSSKAESNLFRQWGADLVNMTVCPEVILAKEAGLLYGSVAIATDYDCWKEADSHVCVSNVMEVFKSNVNKVTKLLLKAVELIGQRNWDNDIDALQKVVQGGLSSA